MKKKTLSIVFSILLLLFFINVGLCLDGKDMIRLKKGGISDETIQTIAREKTIETCSFTVREILDLKNAGLKDKSIRMLIRDGSFMKDAGPVVYGKDIRSIQFTTAKDIIELKEAGVSDEVIQAIIIFGSRDVNDIERDKAWEMLKHMGIIIDMCEGSE
ncbi:MAG: hypothetical protein JRI32_08620 [Deltaproteobacteria bacterium]|nr:hypothetical protein [Deltaproteobacteria bacterium]